MGKGKKPAVMTGQQLVNHQIKQDELEKDEVRKIIKEELWAHIQGAGFWDSFKANVGGSLIGNGAPVVPAPAVVAAPVKAPKEKKKRTINPAMRKRYDLIKELMKTEGLTLPQASKKASQMLKA
jgi:hypothetical protein